MSLVQFQVTALKDDARVLGLVLVKGCSLAIDVEEERIEQLQRAVDGGEVAIVGMKPAASADKAKK